MLSPLVLLIPCDVGTSVVIVKLSFIGLPLALLAVGSPITSLILEVVELGVGLREGEGKIDKTLVGEVAPLIAESSHLIE